MKWLIGYLGICLLFTGFAYAHTPSSKPAFIPTPSPKPTSIPTPTKTSTPTSLPTHTPKPTVSQTPLWKHRSLRKHHVLHVSSQEVQLFFDTTLKREMQRFGIPGAMIAVVQGDKLIVAKGYGVADWQKQIPVTADHTLFRVGSVSKLITATAVMQLVEHGKVHLERDIASYIPNIPVTRRFKKPMTVSQLLTHTSGLDVTDIGDAARRWQDHIPLLTYVAKHTTPQMYPPGRFYVYTNHGFAMLGAIVESLEKTSFATAVQRLVFAPLDMKHSSFAQPLPPSMQTMLARGYARRKTGTYLPLPLDYSNVAPADALVTTAQDMGRFMMAHLHGGILEGQRVLQTHTLQTMHTRQFAYHPALEGHAYGFWEERIVPDTQTNIAFRGLAHTGGQLGFTSKLLLIPELRLGFFICLNRRVGAMRRTVEQQFLRRFLVFPKSNIPAKLPRSSAPPKVTSSFLIQPLSRFTGTYQSYGLPRHTLEKIAYLIIPQTTHTIRTDGQSLWMGRHGKLQHVRDLLFRGTKTNTLIAFAQNLEHQNTHVFIGTTAFTKLAWYEMPALHRSVLLAIFLLFLINGLLWPFQGRRTQQTSSLSATKTSGVWWAKCTLLMMSAFSLLFVVWCIFEFARVSGEGWDYGLYPSTVLMLYMPYVLGLLTLTLSVWTFWIWKTSVWTSFWRGLYTLTTGSSILFLILLYHWCLVGIRSW